MVVVRYDLAVANAATIEKQFLESNHNRRHMDMLARARVALRLLEIERGRPQSQMRDNDMRDARDRVGKTAGLSGRMLQRYWRVLKTPIPVQDALRAGNLALVVAEKIADLKPVVQDEISRRLQAGEEAKAVVAGYLLTAAQRTKLLAPNG